MKIKGIYKIRNCINGKVYIGQSIDINRRFKEHKYNIKYSINHPLYNAFRKYGINNFEFIIIEEVEDVNILDTKEQCWLDYYKSYNSNYGYNLRPKAESMRGYKHSKETRSKMSICKGIKLPEETKLKISISKTGKKRKSFTEEHRKNMRLARNGKPAWNKGIPMTEEQKLNLSVKLKRRVPWNKGKKHSDETKNKMSLAQNIRRGKAKSKLVLFNKAI